MTAFDVVRIGAGYVAVALIVWVGVGIFHALT